MEEYTILGVEQQVSHDTVIGKYAENILAMHTDPPSVASKKAPCRFLQRAFLYNMGLLFF